jgi:hypothetical protein
VGSRGQKEHFGTNFIDFGQVLAEI